MESIDERLMSAKPLHQEKDQEQNTNLSPALRPVSLTEFVGQESIKKKLNLFIEAAKSRQEALGHLLLSGPPGLGKTTLAQIVAKSLNVGIHVITGPHLEKKGDLAAILTQFQPMDILFIDEIHRIPKTVEEVLYGAMEDFRLDLILGQGPAARPLQIDLPRFTLIGATTRAGLLSNPLRDRFQFQLRLDYYPESELQKIIQRSSQQLGFTLSEFSQKQIASRSRGTPRIANRLVKCVRDYLQVHAHENLQQTHSTQPIDDSWLRAAFELFEIDDLGLDPLDRKYLKTIVDTFRGGPVGIETLASATGEEANTLEEVYEPFLLQKGLIQKTPRGRMATQEAIQHLENTKRILKETVLFPK